MDTILLDACFIIGLRDCGKTHLLPKVAKLLDWDMLLPKAAYAECIAKTDDPTLCTLLSNGTIALCKSPSETFTKYHNLYSSLGNGEIDALAYAVSVQKEKNDQIIMVTSDKRTTKVANELGIKTLTTLDFFETVYKLKLMTKEEMHRFIPTLKQYMWLSDKVLSEYLKRIV